MIVKPGDGLMALGWDCRFDLYLPFRRKYFVDGSMYMVVEWLRYGSKAKFQELTGIIRPDVVTTNPLNVSTDPYDFVRRCFTGAITVQRSIRRFEEGNRVHFTDGREAVIDSIIWCTGYLRNFKEWASILKPDADGRVLLYEFVFLPSDDPNIAFVCEQHPLGPHWRVIAAQCELIAQVFAGKLALPPVEVRKQQAKIIDPCQRDTSLDAISEALRYHMMMGRRFPTGWEVLWRLVKNFSDTWTELFHKKIHHFWLVEE